MMLHYNEVNMESITQTTTTATTTTTMKSIIVMDNDTVSSDSEEMIIQEQEQQIMMMTDKTIHATTSRPTGILVFTTNDISNGKCSLSKEQKENAITLRKINKNRRLESNNINQLSVRFSILTIREYPYGLGDNPGAKTGPSLSIEWEYINEQQKSIDEYENEMLNHKRDILEMIMPSDMRIDILKSIGYSRNEIWNEIRLLNIIREQRKITVENLKMIYVEEILEKLSRKSVHILTLGRKKRKEKKYIQDALSYKHSTTTIRYDQYNTICI